MIYFESHLTRCGFLLITAGRYHKAENVHHMKEVKTHHIYNWY